MSIHVCVGFAEAGQTPKGLYRFMFDNVNKTGAVCGLCKHRMNVAAFDSCRHVNGWRTARYYGERFGIRCKSIRNHTCNV